MPNFKNYQQQKKLLQQMAQESPQPYIAGGFAEDAVLHHEPTREHFDIDWFVLREDLEYYKSLAKKYGLTKFGKYGQTKSGEPFYLSCTADESLWIDFVIADKDEKGNIYVEISKFINFDTSTLPKFKSFRVFFSEDTFNYPPTKFDGFSLQTVSPLALYQLRVGLHAYKALGELRDKDIKSMGALKEKFFSKQSDDELLPKTELV